MKNDLRIIDSDMRIMEPMDLWDRYMEVRFKDRAPRPVRVPMRGDLNLLIIDGKEPRANSPTLALDVRTISGKRNNTGGTSSNSRASKASMPSPSSKRWTSKVSTWRCSFPRLACIL